MNPDPDTQLRKRFTELRHAQREAAPAWNPLVPSQPRHEIIYREPRFRWAVAALVVTASLWLLRPSRQSLADLPAWPESAPGHLFAGLSSPSSTDFLLPSHLNIKLP